MDWDGRAFGTRVFYALAAACALLVAADLLYEKHPHFAIERLPGFYGLYGFAAYVGLVLAAKRLRRWLKRREDYYDDV